MSMREEMKEELQSVMERLAERLDGTIAMLERLVSQQGLMASSAEESIGRIVATVENSASLREVELTERLAAAEKTIAELRASAAGASTTGASAHPSRRTVAAGLMAKQEGGIEAASASAALDAALVSLSLEQRIAVKAQLLRAGLV